MSAAAHNPDFARRAGIPVKVAAEFHAADAGHKYGAKHSKSKAALHIVRKNAKRASGGRVKKYADAGAVEDDTPVPTHSRLDVYQSNAPQVDPDAGLSQDLMKKSPLEGREPAQVMETHEPTLGEKVSTFLKGKDTPFYAPRADLVDKAAQLNEYTPWGQAKQAGENIAKGNYQDAALGIMPGAKNAKHAAEVSTDALLSAANAVFSPDQVGKSVAKSLKGNFPKDIASAAVEQGLSTDQIDNLKSHMSPGAQATFDKHYTKMKPKPDLNVVPQAAPQQSIEDQIAELAAQAKATKPDLHIVPKVEQPSPDLGGNFGPSINMKNMTKVGDQLGSNEGGVYQGTSGNKYYIKEGQTPAHVKNELIASSLYDAAGVNTLQYHPVQGGNHIATAWADKEKDNAYKFSPQEHAKAQEDFAVHAWLANHDVVGLGGDNMGVIGGKPTILDNGGALEYRAQGQPKGKSFGNSVDELDSMRGLTPGIKAPDAEKMFGDMRSDDIAQSAMKVVGISDQKIRDIVAAHGGDPKLADKLIARKQDMADRFTLQLHDPNFVEKQLHKHGKDPAKTFEGLEDEFRQEPYTHHNDDEFKPAGKDSDIEDYYEHQEKHEAGPEWAPEESEYEEVNSHLKDSPWKQYNSAKINHSELISKMHEHFEPSDWSKFEPHDVPVGHEERLNFGKNKPEDLEKLGFNTKVPIHKGGIWDLNTFEPGGYPEKLIDPQKVKQGEQAWFAATHPGIAMAYHGGSDLDQMGGAYIAKAPKFYEFDWPKFFGSNKYSDGDMHVALQEAKKMGADVVAFHNMSDSGSHTHGLHSQLAFLNTHGLRAPHANFDPTKLHLAHPLAGLAGGGLFTYGMMNQDNSGGMKEGGKVARKKEKDPEDHEFINFSKGGLIDSSVPGRTDKIPMKVPPGSYVLPADIPSALGQGNTKAGSDVLSKMFTHSAYGLKPMTQKAGAPHFNSFKKLADGGEAEHTPIIAAGGEYIIHPDVVKEVGHGDVSKGHKVLDKFVLHCRKQHIKTLKGLKGPKQ